MRLEGARCLVTGGSRGIGRELALLLAQAGGAVWAGARGSAEREALRSRGVTFLSLDVTDAGNVRAALDEIGRVDVLVNNAGLLVAGAVEEVGDDELRQQYETNLFAPWRLSRAVLPGMREQESGAIVNICSIGGVVPYPGLGAYRSSKYALRCLSWTLHLEVAHFGIRVLNVVPGAVETAFARRSRRLGVGVNPQSPYAGMRSEAEAAYQRIAPARMRPEAVAAKVVEELRKDAGSVDLLIGDDARLAAAVEDDGMDRYEQALVETFGFRWHPISGPRRAGARAGPAPAS